MGATAACTGLAGNMTAAKEAINTSVIIAGKNARAIDLDICRPTQSSRTVAQRTEAGQEEG